MPRFFTSFFTSRVVVACSLIACSLIACSLIAGTAQAHDFPVERSLLAQVSADRVEMMLVYKEPAGPRTDLLMAKFDLDNDGELNGAETRLAQGEMTRRAFEGIRLEFVDERAGMHPPELKLKRDRDGGLAAAFYLKYDLDPGRDTRVFVVRLEGANETVVHLALIVEAGDGVELVKSASPIDGITTKPVELGAPVEHRTVFRVKPSKDASTKGASTDSARTRKPSDQPSKKTSDKTSKKTTK